MGWTYRKASICVSRKSWKPSRNLAEKANKLIGRVSRRLFRAHHCAESTMTLCSAASHCASCWGVTCLCNSRSHLRHTKCMRVRRISVLAVLPLVNPDVCGSQYVSCIPQPLCTGLSISKIVCWLPSPIRLKAMVRMQPLKNEHYSPV
jgi:hypothetical protein